MNNKRVLYILIGAGVVLASILIYLGIKSPQAQAENSVPVVASSNQQALTAGNRTADVFIAEALRIHRSRVAEAERWKAMGEYYSTVKLATRTKGELILDRGQKADASRWKAMGDFYTSKTELNRSQAAEAARWEAMAEFYANK